MRTARHARASASERTRDYVRRHSEAGEVVAWLPTGPSRPMPEKHRSRGRALQQSERRQPCGRRQQPARSDKRSLDRVHLVDGSRRPVTCHPRPTPQRPPGTSQMPKPLALAATTVTT